MSGDHNNYQKDSSYMSYDDLADQFATREPMLDDDLNPTEGWFFTPTDLYHFCEELVRIVKAKGESNE